MPELSRDAVADVCRSLERSPTTPPKAPAIAAGGVTPAELVSSVLAQAEERRMRLPPTLVGRIVAALSHSHVRLMGAPGTGKSTIAQMILEARKGDEYEFALATGQWSAEDIIGGPIPDPDDPRRLVFHPGLVLEAANNGRWVGIDEMNRADIDAAFGELFSLLAGFDTTLPYVVRPGSTKRVKIHAERPTGSLDEGEYGIPPDWRMIATMNSWDKASLARVSFAFSRRWCTVYVPIPDPDIYAKIVEDLLAAHPSVASDGVRTALSLLFVEHRDREPRSLRALGLAMGPGIAVSCVRDMAATVASGLSRGNALLASLEGFVLPQFEGQLEQHDEILTALNTALDEVQADAGAREALSERLGVFTGRIASSMF